MPYRQDDLFPYASGYKGPIGQARPVDRNDPLGWLADQLAKAKKFGNKADIPVIGGMGDLFMGEAPEFLDDMSYGKSPTTGSGQTTQLDPRVMDVAGLPLPYAGAGYAAKALGQKMFDAVPNVRSGVNAAPADMSRRDALKKMGKYGGAAAIAASAPHALLKAMDNISPSKLLDEIPASAAKNVARASRRAISPSSKSALNLLRAFNWSGVDVTKAIKEGRISDLFTKKQQQMPEIDLQTDLNYGEIAKEWMKDQGDSVTMKYTKTMDPISDDYIPDYIDDLKSPELDDEWVMDLFYPDPGGSEAFGDFLYNDIKYGGINPEDASKYMDDILKSNGVPEKNRKLVRDYLEDDTDFMDVHESNLYRQSYNSPLNPSITDYGLEFPE